MMLVLKPVQVVRTDVSSASWISDQVNVSDSCFSLGSWLLAESILGRPTLLLLRVIEKV